MASKKHRPEEIIGKLREAEVVLTHGAATAEACRRVGVTEQTYYRWRKEYGSLKTDQARRMKELDKENQRISVGQWPGVYRNRGAGMARPDRREDALHNAGQPMGEWLL